MAGLHTVPTPAPTVQIFYEFVNEHEEEYLLQKVDDVGGDAVNARMGAGEGVAESSGEQEPAATPTKRVAGGWTELKGRRSMYWGGTLTPSGSLLPAAFPAFMESAYPHILRRIGQVVCFASPSAGTDPKQQERATMNHCLVNEYQAGQGLLPHTDGPAYSPIVATLSLGSHCVLEIRPPPDSDSSLFQPFTVLLPPRSLVVLTEDVYSTFFHGIAAIAGDSISSLQGCANWADYWERRKGTKKENEMARKLVETGKGWERKRRISLTCRRVEKVRKAFRIG